MVIPNDILDMEVLCSIPKGESMAHPVSLIREEWSLSAEGLKKMIERLRKQKLYVSYGRVGHAMGFHVWILPCHWERIHLACWTWWRSHYGAISYG